MLKSHTASASLCSLPGFISGWPQPASLSQSCFVSAFMTNNLFMITFMSLWFFFFFTCSRSYFLHISQPFTTLGIEHMFSFWSVTQSLDHLATTSSFCDTRFFIPHSWRLGLICAVFTCYNVHLSSSWYNLIWRIW